MKVKPNKDTIKLVEPNTNIEEGKFAIEGFNNGKRVIISYKHTYMCE